jgi:hypothetical protein
MAVSPAIETVDPSRAHPLILSEEEHWTNDSSEDSAPNLAWLRTDIVEPMWNIDCTERRAIEPELLSDSELPKPNWSKTLNLDAQRP